jgi:MYXO-CTERM domain-containing protein
MLPEGEIVTIDRVHTADAAHQMYVKFHTNTGGGNLTLAGSVASGVVGNSKVAIHTVLLSGGTPKITQPEVGDCSLSCSYPCGQCDAARFAVDEYSVAVPGPWAVAVHVIDGLDKSDAPATTTSLDDDTIDPAPKQNGGVLGAAVQRGGATSYVVASSAQDGKSPATMTYGVPGETPARHVVFDAPEDANGKSKVTAVAQNGRCVLSIVAGDGLIGRPLMFGVDTAASGCTVTESVAESSSVDAGAHGGTGTGGANGGGTTSNGGTTSGGGASGSGNGGPDGGTAAPAAKASDKGGCGCRFGAGTSGTDTALYAALVALLTVRRRRRRG